jgi:GDPmannose 4,6-dehydratase
MGNVEYSPQDEKHPIKPRSPYGASKAAARHIVKVYRESYNLYAVHGILFNHEGLKRSEEFVTRKITKGIARIVKAIQDGKPFEPIKLGNLDAKRDWSDSEDFCDGVWRMLNQDEFGDLKGYENLIPPWTDLQKRIYFANHIQEYILSSNETHSIREFCEKAIKAAGIEGYWQGKGIDEKFYIADYILDMIDVKSKVIIEVSKEFFRPNEVDLLLGDSSRARAELGWQPKISFDELVKRMVEFDLDEIRARINVAGPSQEKN